ncbi:MAG: O-antigen ligase family protein [Erysipelotrichaceae bacterium]|nr:O-antigen ligase family protein [Erysipelotrichaceae bacterium]
MKKILNKENIFVLILALVALHPFVELDYLFYDSLSRIGLPRLTTVINFLVYPLLVVLVFLFYEKNKKKALIMFGIYAVVLAAFFILHVENCRQLMAGNAMMLPERYAFTVKEEAFYLLTLLLPLLYVYVFRLTVIGEDLLEKISVAIAYLVSFPILLSNIFVFGMSTYAGMTIDNLFSWFSLPFDGLEHQPRFYASKFFFEEGNPIGILLFLTLPLLYYFFYKAENRNRKIFLGITIFIQSLAMIVLSTRIATFGALLVPAVMLLIYLFLLFLKTERFQKFYPLFLIGMLVVTGVFIPVCPAVQNQLISSQDILITKQHDDLIKEERQKIKEGVYEKWSDEWREYYVQVFDEYSFLIALTPPAYYNTFYSYSWDPQFWVDLAFDHPLEERVNGRQIEKLFFDYKHDDLTAKDKLLGMGYSEYMWGGILIERDFVQQAYTLGYIGFVLLFVPWLILAACAGIKLLLGYKCNKWTYLNITLMMIVCIGFASSYVSGHTMDKLTCSMVLALCLGKLLHDLKGDDHE